MALHLLRAFLSQANSYGSRSTALGTIQWLMAILLGGLIALFSAKAATWSVGLVGAMLALAFVLYLYAYLFFMFKDPDALRSERYSLRRMEIEKGLIGDNVSGLLDPARSRSNVLDVDVAGSVDPEDEQ